MYIRKRTDQSWVQLRDLRFGVFQKTPVEIYFAITVPKFVGKLPDLDGGYWMLDAGPDSPACPESLRETQSGRYRDRMPGRAHQKLRK